MSDDGYIQGERVVDDSTGRHMRFVPILLLSRLPKKSPFPIGTIAAFFLVFFMIVVLFSEKAVHDKDDTQSGTIDVVFDQPKPPPPPPLQQPPQPPQILDPPPEPKESEIPPPAPQPKPPPPTKWLPSPRHIPKKMTPPPPKPLPPPRPSAPQASSAPSKMAKNDAPAQHSGDVPKGNQLTCSAPERQYRTFGNLHGEGEAIAEIELDKNGTIMRERLVQTTGNPDLDNQALETVSKLHCSPPPDGQPMIGRIPMEFNFARQ